MSKIIWDAIGEHKYETGIDHGVLYPINTETNTYDNGVAWNGLTSISETPSGAESNPQYADNIKYLDLYSAETFGATVACFTYPKEWEECDGSVSPLEGVNIYQQSRKTFGLSYRTKIGNDLNPDAGYKLHLIYNAKATPSERAYNTVNESPEALNFSYTISTTPVDVPGYKPTSLITIDSTKYVTDEAKARLAALEAILYGTDASEGKPAVYEEDTDAEFSPSKTYYTEYGGVYTVFDQFDVTSDSSFDPSKTYYEKNGDVYTATADSTMDPSKTYYEIKAKVSGTKYYTLKTPAVPATVATNPRLPMPAEVISILQDTNG